MKKVFIIIVSIFISCGISRGDEYTASGCVEFGGTASYISNKATNILTLAPEFSYFLKDRISIGGTFNYMKVKNVSGTTSLVFAPRYFLKSNRENMYLYGSILLNLKKNDTAFGAEAGVKIELLESCLLNLAARYIANNAKDIGLFTGFTFYR